MREDNAGSKAGQKLWFVRGEITDYDDAERRRINDQSTVEAVVWAKDRERAVAAAEAHWSTPALPILCTLEVVDVREQRPRAGEVVASWAL